MPKRPLKDATDLGRTFLEDPDYASSYRETANEEIGAALRALREAKEMSQREVAAAMGVTRSRVSQIEASEGTSLALSVLDRYARALGCHLEITLRDDRNGVAADIFVPELPVTRPERRASPGTASEAESAIRTDAS